MMLPLIRHEQPDERRFQLDYIFIQSGGVERNTFSQHGNCQTTAIAAEPRY